jgi:hypothetical protein
MTSQLIGSSFANGALLPNYVNGRLLAAADLATGQATLLQRDTMTGQAAGPGVVSGLWVTASATTLTVAAGLGLTPAGEPVCVPVAVTLPLAIAGTPATPASAGFSACVAAAGGSQSAVTTGAYLLTAMPACQPQGMAPMAIAPGSDTPVACTAQWQVEGVQFKAIPLPLQAVVDGVTVTAANCRNLLAHWCLGTAQLASLGADPFNFAPAYRGLDQLASADLTPCDLPLCVFYWDAGAISFIDNWSVRRRITRPDVSASSWSGAVADQRPADGEARFLQFQDQVLDVVAAGASRATVASSAFGLLPPVGFLPIAMDTTGHDIAVLQRINDDAAAKAGNQSTNILPPVVLRGLAAGLVNLSPQSGFAADTFFGGLNCFLGGALSWDVVYFALRQSYFAEPLAVAQAASASPVNETTADEAGPNETAANEPATAPRTATSRPASLLGAAGVTGIRTSPFPVLRHLPVWDTGAAPPAPAPALPEAIVYYFVIENLLGLYNALNGTGPAVTPYLVFMKNQAWLAQTRTPFSTFAE